VKKSKRQPMKTIEVEPSVGDFNNLRLNSTVIEQKLPILPKAPETTELVSDLQLNFNHSDHNKE
jgi:hypothetical protein